MTIINLAKRVAQKFTDLIKGKSKKILNNPYLIF
jgi:hypothetical protein